MAMDNIDEGLGIEEVREIVHCCSIPDKDFYVGIDSDGRSFFIQIRYIEDDVLTGVPAPQHGRKWRISRFATKSEIIQTCFAAALASAEHQVRESFKYAPTSTDTPRAIFGPHFDSDVLYSICGKRANYDARSNLHD